MSAGLRRLLLVLALVAGAAVGASASAGGGKAQAIRDALAAGQPVVLALAKELPGADASETDADWAHYLNTFAAAHKRYKVVPLNAAEARSVLANPPSLDESYATIFMRSAKSAVIYDGPVLEKSVYNAAAAYLDSKDGTFDHDIFDPFELHLK